MKKEFVKLENDPNMKIISNSGILAILEYFRKLKFDKNISKILSKRKKNDYDDSKLFIASLCAIIGGATVIDDFSKFLSKNRWIAERIGLNKIPKTQVFYAFLERIGKKEKVFEKLKDINKQIIDTHILKDSKKPIVEIDATYMSSYQKEAQYNYKNEKSYSCLMEHIGTQRMIYDFELRTGNTSPKEGIYDMLNKLLSRINKKILLISDSAGYQFNIIQKLKQTGNEFVIKMRNSESLSQVTSILTNKWKEVSDIYSIAESDFVMEKSNSREYLRTIHIKRRNELFSSGTICTNIEQESANPVEIFRIYRERTNEELAIKEFKLGFAGDYIPSKKMSINKIFVLLNVFAYNFVTILQYQLTQIGIIIDSSHKRLNNKRFRFLFINIAGRIIKSSRRTILKVALEKEHFFLFNKIYMFCSGFII